MRILIAGGSGVLGRTLIPLLTTAGHEVTATTRYPGRGELLARLGATPAVVDAFDAAALSTIVNESGPDTIIHLLTDLATLDVIGNARLRTVGTRNLVDAAIRARTPRIVAESISWIYPPGYLVADETDAFDPDPHEPRRTTIAAVSALESAVSEVAEHVVLRFGQLYGPGTWFSATGRYGEDARAGRLPATETVASFIHTADAAHALLLALQWRSGAYNVVDDEPASGHDWVPHFAAAIGASQPALSSSGNAGRPVSNKRAHASGLDPQYPTWRDGFTFL